MKKIIATLAISAATIGAANADILVMGYDKDAEALVALTDIPCQGVDGKIAGAMTKDKKKFIGCWTGDGGRVNIYFPTIDKIITYDVRMFFTLDRQFNKTEGGIRGTI
jgi:hypothetical protein